LFRAILFVRGFHFSYLVAGFPTGVETTYQQEGVPADPYPPFSSYSFIVAAPPRPRMPHKLDLPNRDSARTLNALATPYRRIGIRLADSVDHHSIILSFYLSISPSLYLSIKYSSNLFSARDIVLYTLCLFTCMISAISSLLKPLKNLR